MKHRINRRCAGLTPCKPRGDYAAEVVTLTPSSACTVTTQETKLECELAVASFLRLYPGVPVYVVVLDDESRDHIKGCEFNGVTVVEAVMKPVRTHNTIKTYHREEVLIHKMTAMRSALERHDDVLFFDADMVFCSWLTVTGLDAWAILSHSSSIRGELVRTGVFNGGMVWTRAKHFPDWWQARWLKHGKADELHEQTPLNDVPEIMSTEYFSRAHNIGFWQGDIGKRQVKSLHVHLTDCIDHTVQDEALEEIKAFREQAWTVLQVCYPEVYEMALAVFSQRKREETVEKQAGDVVLFLDVDGVLNLGKASNYGLVPELVERLRGVLAGYVEEKRFKLVLSSTWRTHESGRKKIGKEFLIHDMTPVLKAEDTGAPVTRGHEIAAYLMAHAEVRDYVILDDNVKLQYEQLSHWVRTEEAVGFTEVAAVKLTEKLDQALGRMRV